MDFFTRTIPETYHGIVNGLLPKKYTVDPTGRQNRGNARSGNAGRNVSPQPESRVAWPNYRYSGENNKIAVKVFNPAPLVESVTGIKKFSDIKRLLYTAQIDTSQDIFEQIAELVYLEDWGSVEVIGENTTSNSSAIKIDLKEIETVTNMSTVGKIEPPKIQACMLSFKNKFNRVCTQNIDNSRRKYEKVWLEVTKKIFEDPGWAQMKPEDMAGTFKAIDITPKDEKIVIKEWVLALKGKKADDFAEKLGLEVMNVKGISEAPAKTRATTRFSAIDTNNDRSLSLDEFSKFYENLSKTKKLVDLKHDLWIEVAAGK